MTGSFAQAFGGFYGDLFAGQLRAMVQGQFGLGAMSVSDAQSALDGATLATFRYDLSARALYELAFGDVRLKPQVGVDVTSTAAWSHHFADVGAMQLSSRPTLDAFAGASLSTSTLLPDGSTRFVPVVGVFLHDELSPDSALFTPAAGGSATVPLRGLGTYGAVTLGADLLRAPTASLEAALGFKADFKFGPSVRESAISAYAKLKF
jgi:hypothetical protein